MDKSRFIQGMRCCAELSDKERRRIIRRSLKKDPWKLKCTIAMEEFAELQQQISKQIRGYGDKMGLLEEIADAYICLSFLESIFDISSDDVQRAIDVKLDRERSRL
jgi:NTP pyrophosphatase (non-canonical NTP hydrolase)